MLSPESVAAALEDGLVVGLLGPARSGTSRLVDAIAASSSPWPTTAVIPQRVVLVGELSVGENLHLSSLLRRRAPTDDQGWIAVLGIDHLLERLPGSISVGEQQRIMIGRALLADPAVLVADEPTAHQDPERSAAVLGALTSHAHRGRKVLIATHDPAVAASADRVLHLAAPDERNAFP